MAAAQTQARIHTTVAAVFWRGVEANCRQMARIGMGEAAAPAKWAACTSSRCGLPGSTQAACMAKNTSPPSVQSSAHTANPIFASGVPGSRAARSVSTSSRIASSSPVAKPIRPPRKNASWLTPPCKVPIRVTERIRSVHQTPPSAENRDLNAESAAYCGPTLETACHYNRGSHMKRFFAGFLTVCAALTFLSCKHAPPAGVAAEVNGVAITYAELDKLQSQSPQRLHDGSN